MIDMKKAIKAALITLAVLLVLVIALAIRSGVSNDKPLSKYWTDDSAAAESLRDYVSKVTDPSNKNHYIPPEDRIAVFDLDGTLICETFYTHYDAMMFREYCLEDHPDMVSDELKEIASSITPDDKADGSLPEDFAGAYAGLTVKELYDYAVQFGEKETQSFTNMRYKDGFYLPMAELIEYLHDNDFTIYIMSGTERTTARAIIANSPVADYVEPENIIGADIAMDFKYEEGDDPVFTGELIQNDLNGNRTIYMDRELGKRPVLAFGNSGSDVGMMNYTIDKRNPYPAQAYMIVADDSEREWGDQFWDEKAADCLAQGFIPVSMHDEFAQIYPDDVGKAARQYK